MSHDALDPSDTLDAGEPDVSGTDGRDAGESGDPGEPGESGDPGGPGEPDASGADGRGAGKPEPADRGRRRLLLLGAGALAAAFGTSVVTTIAGSAGRGRRGRTQVVVVWAGGELDRFLDVLAGYDRQVEVTSAGDDIDALLRARRRTGNSPDVAIISRPGLIRGYVRQGWLSPVASRLANRYPAPWNDLLRFDGDLYGVWLKAAHKSLFWHRSSTLDHAPRTWDELVDLVRRLASGGSGGEGAGRAPLAVGAADGWVLTDWFENLLAAQATPQLYQALGRGQDLWDDEAVRESLTRLAQLWSVPGVFPGGGERALLTQFDQSAMQLATGRAALLYGADFASSVLRSFSDPAREDERLRSFRFPSPTERQPLVVGGDAAVVFDDSPRGHRLAEWLADGHVFLPWVRAGGYLSPNTAIATDAYPDPLLRSFAADLRVPDDGLHFDLSDQLPAQVNGQDGQGSWAILQDFFAAVTTEGADLDAVVERAVTRLADEVRRARQAEDEVALR